MGRLLRGTFAECYDGDLFTLPDGSPRLWWIDPSIWAERHNPDTVNREVEDETLKRMYKQARALTRFKRWRNVLTGLERKAVSLELDYMRENRQPPPVTPETPPDKRTLVSLAWGEYYRDKWQWIAKRMGQGFTPLQVRALLDDASRVMMDAESMNNQEVIEMVYARKFERQTRAESPLLRLSDYDLKQIAREVLYEEKKRAA